MEKITMSLKPYVARQLINIIYSVVDEFRLTITPDAWIVKAVDPANVAALLINLPKDNFVEWNGPQETLKLGIDTNKVSQFVNIGKPSESYILIDGDTLPIQFSIDDLSTTNGRRWDCPYQLKMNQGMFSRTIHLLPEASIRKEPNMTPLSWNYIIKFNTIELKRIIKKASEVDDYLRSEAKAEQDKVIFTASTRDDNEDPWSASKPVEFTARSNIPEASLQSIDYLNDFIQVIHHPDVNICIRNEYPLKISFPIGGTGTVDYIIAPRIESE